MDLARLRAPNPSAWALGIAALLSGLAVAVIPGFPMAVAAILVLAGIAMLLFVFVASARKSEGQPVLLLERVVSPGLERRGVSDLDIARALGPRPPTPPAAAMETLSPSSPSRSIVSPPMPSAAAGGLVPFPPTRSLARGGHHATEPLSGIEARVDDLLARRAGRPRRVRRPRVATGRPRPMGGTGRRERKRKVEIRRTR